MRSRDRAAQSGVTAALAWKEGRELVSLHASWLLALSAGPLVGQGFITAVRTYAEMSAGSGGGMGALAEGLSPLDGVVVPTFGAYALIATLLLPFVAIRLVSEEKQSGAMAVMSQSGVSMRRIVAVKFGVLVVAWLVTWVPGLIALELWRGYGGHLATAETLTVLLGHFLHGALVIAIALAAASVTSNASSAAIVTLGVTLGGWALDFVAGVQGGVAARIGRFTPEAMLHQFEQGEVDWNMMGVSLLATIALLVLAAIALEPGRPRKWHVRSAAMVLVVALGGQAALAFAPASLDATEDRRHSLPVADARALGALHGTLIVDMHLGPQDPRRVDLERGVLHKLARVMTVRVTTSSATSTGMFDRDPAYGEVWYVWGARREMTRSTTLPIVLELLYSLTGTPRSTPDQQPSYSGYPLATSPRFAAVFLHVAWPLTVVLAWMFARRRGV